MRSPGASPSQAWPLDQAEATDDEGHDAADANWIDFRNARRQCVHRFGEDRMPRSGRMDAVPGEKARQIGTGDGPSGIADIGETVRSGIRVDRCGQAEHVERENIRLDRKAVPESVVHGLGERRREKSGSRTVCGDGGGEPQVWYIPHDDPLGTEPTLFNGPVVALPKAWFAPRPPPSTGPATSVGRPSIAANWYAHTSPLLYCSDVA